MNEGADRILRNSIRRTTSYESLSAEIRVEITMYGQQLVGTGTYRQLGPITDQLLRLDLDVGPRESNLRLLQVNGGRYLWVRRDFPSIDNPGEREQSVSRIDLRAVRDVVLRHQPDWKRETIIPELISVGGIGQFLRDLEQSFDFESAVRSDQLRGHPVWLLRGHWRGTYAPDTESRLSTAGYLPRTVVLWLGQTDGLPYRVSYYGNATSKGRDRVAPPQLAVLDILAVEFSQIIDPRHFSFKHNDFDDMTMRFLSKLSLANESSRR